jgi:hypothetical protein
MKSTARAAAVDMVGDPFGAGGECGIARGVGGLFSARGGKREVSGLLWRGGRGCQGEGTREGDSPQRREGREGPQRAERRSTRRGTEESGAGEIALCGMLIDGIILRVARGGGNGGWGLNYWAF